MNTELITNNRSDKYHVSIVAKKNVVRGWSCATLEDAVTTATEFLTENPGMKEARIRTGSMADGFKLSQTIIPNSVKG